MNTEPRPIALTFDTDWAPPFVIEEVLALLDGVPSTFFLTDGTAMKVLERAPNVELGVHPNFLPGSSHGTTRRQVLDTVMQLVPGAQVVKSHHLFQDATVLDLYVERGLHTDVSLLEYQNPTLRPFHYWNGLVRIPCNFRDDVACVRRETRDDQRWMWSASAVICSFHPIHVYLNTDTLERYAALRNQGGLVSIRPSVLADFVNRDTPGIRTVLTNLLGAISKGVFVPHTVSDLVCTLPLESWYASNRPLSIPDGTYPRPFLVGASGAAT